MDLWKEKNKVYEVLQTLPATHNKVIIVGNYMGTLFAIQEAIDNPIEKIENTTSAEV